MIKGKSQTGDALSSDWKGKAAEASHTYDGVEVDKEGKALIGNKYGGMDFWVVLVSLMQSSDRLLFTSSKLLRFLYWRNSTSVGSTTREAIIQKNTESPEMI